MDYYKLVELIIGIIPFLPKKSASSNLADYLEEIASCCKNALNKFKNGDIPREEGKNIAILINSADIIASKTESTYPELYNFFSKEILSLGKLLRDADFYTDGEPRSPQHRNARSYELEIKEHPYLPKGEQLKKCCEELERIIGSAQGYASSLRKNRKI